MERLHKTFVFFCQKKYNFEGKIQLASANLRDVSIKINCARLLFIVVWHSLLYTLVPALCYASMLA